jgi:hypothetical protein
MLHHVGDPQNYIDGAPKNYDHDMNIIDDSEGKTWRERLNIEAEDVYKQGIIDAEEAEHQKDSVPHHTVNHDTSHLSNTPLTALSQNKAGEWDQELLWSTGPVKDYREGSPNGYHEFM